jgi:hypothetical protein
MLQCRTAPSEHVTHAYGAWVWSSSVKVPFHAEFGFGGCFRQKVRLFSRRRGRIARKYASFSLQRPECRPSPSLAFCRYPRQKPFALSPDLL